MAATLVLLVWLTTAISTTSAYTVYHPNCTLPEEPVNFVYNPQVRGTLQLLWTCLATIIACTYTILHLNLPEQRCGRDPGWKGDVKWLWKTSLWPGLKWSLSTIIAPEFILAKYIVDYFECKRILRQLCESLPDEATRRSWTLTHVLFADMGGLAVRYQKPGTRLSCIHIDEEGEPRLRRSSSTGRSTKDHVAVEMSPFPDSTHTTEGSNLLTPPDGIEHTAGASDTQSPPATRSGSNDQTRTSPSIPGEMAWRSMDDSEHLILIPAKALKSFMEEGIISEMAPVSKDEIMDRSKSSIFTKVITVGQVLYFCIGVITRVALRLPVAQLEVAVIGFALCGIIAYLFSWYKPKGVNIPFVLARHSCTAPEYVAKMSRAANETTSFPAEQEGVMQRIRNDTFEDSPMLIVGAVILGAVHLAA